MPYTSNEPRYAHLEFVREEIIRERRPKKGFPGSRPDRGDRTAFGNQLQQATGRLLQEQANKQPPLRGINPRLVFRVPLEGKPDYKKLITLFEQSRMSVVSIEADGAVVVFDEDTSLQAFRRQIVNYQRGPRRDRDGNLANTSVYDILEFIDPAGMRSWRREDRIGARLVSEIGAQGEEFQDDQIYIVEIELWHPGTQLAAQRLIHELHFAYQNLATGEERWLDQYIGSGLLLAKVRTSGATLNILLEQDVIATVDLPLTATFDVQQAQQATERTFPTPPAPPIDGPRLCVVDSGIASNHPLLRPYVGHEEAILTSNETVSDLNGHGTRVAALAVYGDVRACYERGQFESTITLYSARVLNEYNQFDNELLIINQLRRAIEVFRQPPYNCSIFNVSIGGATSAFQNGQRRQNVYGECLDILAREYQVLFVVSAGNHKEVTHADNIDDALTNYPAGLLQPTTQLCDFATTALGLTVGALAEVDTVAYRSGNNAQDIVRQVAQRNEPAPMTRVGPGVQRSIKPELVHYGGSFVFDRNRPQRLVQDNGMAVMSFSNKPLQQLFAYDSGTSYAAPRVARLAALVEHQLGQQLNETPHPNLIRAILATSARIPDPARTALQRTNIPYASINVCGYGLPDEEYALRSTAGRVVLFAQTTILHNNLHFYRVPVPDCLLQASGLRCITVALAFDPPTLARRLDYLGVEMNFQMIRGKTFDEVQRVYSRLGPDEEPESPNTLQFEPKSTTRNASGYSRDKSTLQCGSFTMRGAIRKNYGNDYWLVIRSKNGWVGEEQPTQSYAIAVVLEAATPELYAQVRQRIQQRTRIRV